MKKQLTRIDVLGLVIGSVIGWGAFTLPGKQFLPTSGVVNTTLGLVIGGDSGRGNTKCIPYDVGAQQGRRWRVYICL